MYIAQLGLPLDAPIVAYTGAIFQQDARLMAAAFDRVHAQLPQAKLLLIGYTNVAIEEMVLKKTAVMRTGPISFADLATYVAAADIGWIPLVDNGANQGRFPMKVHDFMAAGRPLVVTDVGDLGRFVQQHELGWVTADQPDAIAEALIYALSQPASCRTIGQQARHVAETHFAWPIVTEKLLSFYQRYL